MVKICHITSAHDNRDIRILEKECVSLAKNKNFDVYLVVRGESETYKNVNIIGIGASPSGRLKRVLCFSKKAYEKAVEIDADVYHLHDPELLLYAKRFKKCGKKVIFDSHENYCEQIKIKSYIPKFLRGFIANFYRCVENRACRYLDGAIFPCPYKGKHIFEGRVKNTEFIDNVPILEESVLGSCDVKKDPNSACVAGLLSYERGTGNLIDACCEAGVKLIMAGRFSSKEYEDSLKSRGSYAVVDYRGVCGRKEVAEIYREAFIGTSILLPAGQYSRLANLPTKVYEYMMFEMPFIISDFPYFKWFVDKYHCGICVCPTDVHEIAEALSYLKNHPDEAAQMGRNGKEAVLNDFNWGIEEKKLYTFYQKIIPWN